MPTHIQNRPVSRATYTHYKCRCDGCVDANRQYHQALRDRLATMPRDATDHVIGQPVSSSTYTNYRCRCDGCRQVHRDHYNSRRPGSVSGQP